MLIAAETREEKQRHCVRFNPSVSRHSFKTQLFDTLDTKMCSLDLINLS